MSKWVVANGYNRDGVVANINEVVTKARAADVPVIWIQHETEELPKGSETWQIVPELVPKGGGSRSREALWRCIRGDDSRRGAGGTQGWQSGDLGRANRCLCALDAAWCGRPGIRCSAGRRCAYD